MSTIEELMNHYLEKTDGAFIEKKESTIVFDFADAENLFGQMIA
jgi:trehalose-6-phosphatase